MPECDVCGREFDTDRGVQIHARQVHDDKQDTDDTADTDDGADTDTTEVEKTASLGPLSLTLRLRHALFGAFVIGVLTGGFFISTLFGAAGVTGMMAATPDQPTDTGTDAPSDQPTQNDGPAEGTADMTQVSLDGEPTMGPADAPVTIVLFEDFQCPFCKRFEQETLPQIVSNYVDSGDARLVWKDIPLPQLGHDWAEPAAAAMECVYREGGNDAFWAVKDELFDTAKTLTRGSDEFTPDNVQSRIMDMAENQGVSRSAVSDCIENGNPMEEVRQDKSDAQTLGVSGTPTILINGQKVVGAQPYSAFKQVIDSQLSN